MNREEIHQKIKPEHRLPSDPGSATAPGDEREGRPNRTVHWTWKDRHPPEDVFPPWWQESWREEGWQCRLWTDVDIAEFVGSEFPELESLMNSYASGVMRADAFRLLLLKRVGGLYVDLDFVKLKPLDWLPASFACAAQGEGVLCNAFLWAPGPGDPFLDGIEESLLARAGRRDAVHATGPKLLTAHAAGGRQLTCLPTPWLYPVGWDDEERIRQIRAMSLEELQKNFPEAKAIHIWCNTWGWEGDSGG